MIWTALIIGFAGSLHCLGMCSPLAMAVTNMSSAIVVNRLLYNLGRVFTYGFLGCLIATVGMPFSLMKYQNVLSILLGISLLVIGFAGLSAIRIPIITQALARFSLLLKKLFAKFIQRKKFGSTFILGAVNGLLPCGLSFLALTYCITLADAYDGFAFMVWFGIGTLPVMLGLTSVFVGVVKRFHVNVKAVTTGLLILSGLILIARVFIVHLPQGKSIHEGVVDIVLCR